jgi:hypothetical protein
MLTLFTWIFRKWPIAAAIIAFLWFVLVIFAWASGAFNGR